MGEFLGAGAGVSRNGVCSTSGRVFGVPRNGATPQVSPRGTLEGCSRLLKLAPSTSKQEQASIGSSLRGTATTKVRDQYNISPDVKCCSVILFFPWLSHDLISTRLCVLGNCLRSRMITEEKCEIRSFCGVSNEMPTTYQYSSA